MDGGFERMKGTGWLPVEEVWEEFVGKECSSDDAEG